jgi:hypothetical protein
MLEVPFAESLQRRPAWSMTYDVEAWRHDHYRKPLSSYRLNGPLRYQTFVKSEIKALIESRVRVFGEHPSGLGRFTRTIFAKDLRRQTEQLLCLAAIQLESLATSIWSMSSNT